MAGDFSIYPKWRGLLLVPSDAAMREMAFERMDLLDVKEVLEFGEEPGRRRKVGTIEMVLGKGVRSCKVVVAKSFNFSMDCECWVVVHVKSVKL